MLIHLFMDEGFEIFDLALDNIWCRVILSPRLYRLRSIPAVFP